MRQSFTHRLICGDALQVLSRLDANSIDCVITSPPYWNLRDYGVPGQLGHETLAVDYVAALAAVFEQVYRILTPHGTAWLNLGDRYVKGRLLGLPWSVAFALDEQGWIRRSEVIWCLSGGTRLYARTQKGDTTQTLHDLVRLDPQTVQLWNGERWTDVLSWTRSEGQESLQIELASGERIGCTAGHVWPTQRGDVRADELVLGDVVETTVLPEPDEPEMPYFLPDEEVGWLVGRYLACGSLSSSNSGTRIVQIACHADRAEALAARLALVAEGLHGNIATYFSEGKRATVNLSGRLIAPLIQTYIHGDSARTKLLTSQCWRRSNRFLQALLDGYLDGDGHYDAGNDRWRLCLTRNDRLADDLRTIAGRLGLQFRLAPRMATIDGKPYPCYRGDLRLTPTTHHNARKDGEIVAFHRLRGSVQFWDVEVADEPHLFALASGVLTHNSKPNAQPDSGARRRPGKAHETIFMLAKRLDHFYDAEAVLEPAKWERWGKQTTKKRTHDGLLSWMPDRPKEELTSRTTKRRRSVWSIPTANYAGAHEAVFPEKLVEPMILSGCPAGGTVLDPFCGTGVTLAVAKAHGRASIGIDLDPNSLAQAHIRLAGCLPVAA